MARAFPPLSLINLTKFFFLTGTAGGGGRPLRPPLESATVIPRLRYKLTRSVYFTIDWLVVLRIYVALAIFQPYRDLEAGEIVAARLGIEPRTNCSESQEFNHYTTGAPLYK